MFTPSWLSEKPLKEQLSCQPWRWQLVQAVRIAKNAGTPFRLEADPIYGYPCAEVSKVRQTSTGWHFMVTGHALHGYNGMLPYAYQDDEKNLRLVSGNRNFCDFLDALQQRTLVMSAKVTASSNLSIRCEELNKAKQPLPEALLKLFGVILPTRYLPAENLIRYAIALNRPESTEWLSNLLRNYFQLDIHIASPQVVRLAISNGNQTCLRSRINHHTNCVGYLGRNAVLGSCCYVLSSKIKVVISVSSFAQYKKVIADLMLAPAILEMCRLYFSLGTTYCLQIKCPRGLLPAPKLKTRFCESAARLGRQSCLKSKAKDDAWVTVDYPLNSL